MGQFSHGGSRAWYSHVLRYGFRTIRGRALGVRVDALARATSARREENRIVGFLDKNEGVDSEARIRGISLPNWIK